MLSTSSIAAGATTSGHISDTDDSLSIMPDFTRSRSIPLPPKTSAPASSSMSPIPIDIGKDVPAFFPHEKPPLREIKEQEVCEPCQIAENFLNDYKAELSHYLERNLAHLSAEVSTPQVFKVSDQVYLQIAAFRADSALGNQVLKSDIFAGLHRLDKPNAIPGCSNFRQAKNKFVPVYGVSQPTVLGIEKLVQNLLKSNPKRKRVIWVNLREEPIVYVNKKPFCFREQETLDINLDYLLGIASQNLQDLEERLRADLVSSIKSNGEVLEYYFQGETRTNELLPEVVEKHEVRTVKQVYDDIASKGPAVHFKVS
jgi:hypothetical protein